MHLDRRAAPLPSDGIDQEWSCWKPAIPALARRTLRYPFPQGSSIPMVNAQPPLMRARQTAATPMIYHNSAIMATR
jgi:hypothetical protein